MPPYFKGKPVRNGRMFKRKTENVLRVCVCGHKSYLCVNNMMANRRKSTNRCQNRTICNAYDEK